MTDAPLMARPWNDLAAHFRANPWPATQAIADLCDQLASDRSGAGLLGAATGHVLRITQAAAPDGAYLEIAPTERGPTQFRFIDTAAPERMWRRHEPPERVVERFYKATALIGWTAAD